MKTLRHTLAMLMIIFTTAAASAQPMSYIAMRNNARFLTDRMAYTLGLSAALIDDLYLINYDYICGVNEYLDDVALGYRYDDYMEVVYARDYALRRLLNEAQWARLMAYDYFYRPISFVNHRWSFGIYAYDRRPNHFYYGVPRRFNDYRGGHFFGGMRPGPHYDGRPGGHPANPRVGRAGDINRPGGNNNGRPNGGPNPNVNARPNTAPNARPNVGQENLPNVNARPNTVPNARPNVGQENRPNVNARPNTAPNARPNIAPRTNTNVAPNRPSMSTRSSSTMSGSRPSMPSSTMAGGRSGGSRGGGSMAGGRR